jgi:hypothetical protein
MKAVKTIALLLAFGISLSLTAAERNEVAQFSSYDFDQGKRYDFSIHDDVLSRTPAWRVDKEFPPLSPRKAEASAREQLKKLVKEPERWSRRTIELHEMEAGKWIYLVKFNGFHPLGVFDGPVPTMGLVVLMDGSVIDPRISPYETADKGR